MAFMDVAFHVLVFTGVARTAPELNRIAKNLWPECTVIYKFNATTAYSTAVMEAFSEITAIIEDNTDVRFLLWKRGYSKNMVIFDSNTTGSDYYYGYLAREYRINIFYLNLFDNTYFTVLKQILVVLGFTEEQHRMDRDEYLNVYENNILGGCEYRALKFPGYPPVDIPFSIQTVMFGDPTICCEPHYCWDPKNQSFSRDYGQQKQRTQSEVKSALALEMSRIRAFYPSYYCSNFGFPEGN